MIKRRNYNIYVGDKAYQMNFFLDFKSKKSETKFQDDALSRTQQILNVFIIFSSLLVVWSIVSTLCFNFDQGSRFSFISAISLICLFLSLFLSRTTNPRFIINLMLLIPTSFIYLIILDIIKYQLGLYVIVAYSTILSKSDLSILIN
jgi:hypothetical protein